MPGGYQTQVFNQPSIGVAGNRASLNMITTYDAGPGGLVADIGGVGVGLFAWVIPPTDPNGTCQVATQANGSGNVAGYLYNDTQALNTVFLSDGTMVIPQGLPVALATNGDFFVVNNGTTEATVGMKAYASFGTGEVSFAATGSPASGASATGSTIAAETFSVTGSISSDILTVTNVASGTVYPGSSISGTGITGGPKIASQLTQVGDDAGAEGTYLLTVSQQAQVPSTTIAGTYGLMTVGTLTTTAPFQVGDSLAATGSVVAGTQITAIVTGTGGTGSTMVVNNNTAVGTPQVVSAIANVETKWYAASSGQPGAIIKITSWVGPQG